MSKYMFSEQRDLLCYTDEEGYHVVNGGWLGIRTGDSFEVCYNHKGHPNNKTLTIVDWVEIDPSLKSKDWKHQYYLY